ncbi:hypothetical protein GCM10017083_17820 [Thalassobaculum fulvum]|uniref:Uncharacterized protein n=1 Tax=Thalassobaculum fulvum TaxID=1633335 RepID=A0A918XQR2_9PROT|nr:hypothetical protein GCM10017083_17820 [Thalassobaculum fulvum]
MASLAIISETTSPAPNRRTIRRNGRSDTPDMGASITGSRRLTGPIDMLIFWADRLLDEKLGNVSVADGNRKRGVRRPNAAPGGNRAWNVPRFRPAAGNAQP